MFIVQDHDCISQKNYKCSYYSEEKKKSFLTSHRLILLCFYLIHYYSLAAPPKEPPVLPQATPYAFPLSLIITQTISNTFLHLAYPIAGILEGTYHTYPVARVTRAAGLQHTLIITATISLQPLKKFRALTMGCGKVVIFLIQDSFSQYITLDFLLVSTLDAPRPCIFSQRPVHSAPFRSKYLLTYSLTCFFSYYLDS